MVDDDVGGGEAAAVGGGPGRDTEAEGHVPHGVDDDALVLRRVLRDAPQAGFEHVVAVEEGQL
jgi:hypothetical protein